MGPKALSLGTALFLVMGALIFNRFPSGSASAGGVLGGPSAQSPMDTLEEAVLYGEPAAMPNPPGPAALPQEGPSAASLAAPAAVALGNKISPASALALGYQPDDSGSASLPRLLHYFIQPAAGLNYGILHPHNAVDIANVCGTPVVAAADGIVVAADQGGWNGGYGSYVTLEHPNGTRTKYAHLEKVLVSTGDQVQQGGQIATIGDTGFVHGPSGCHLHFEVYGAANPFARM